MTDKKPCRHCLEEINAKANICKLCRMPQRRFSGLLPYIPFLTVAAAAVAIVGWASGIRLSSLSDPKLKVVTMDSANLTAFQNIGESECLITQIAYSSDVNSEIQVAYNDVRGKSFAVVKGTGIVGEYLNDASEDEWAKIVEDLRTKKLFSRYRIHFITTDNLSRPHLKDIKRKIPAQATISYMKIDSGEILEEKVSCFGVVIRKYQGDEAR